MKRTALRRKSHIRPVSKVRAGVKRTTIAQLDELWKRAVKLRDGWKCQKPGCGSNFRLQAHHVYTCRIYGLRWAILNGVALCSGHHRFWAHQHSQDFHRWWVERVGVEAAEVIDARARMKSKAPIDKELIRLHLEAEIQKYEVAL